MTDPFVTFVNWEGEAISAGESLHESMCLATVDASGRANCRMVLYKEFSKRGIVFYTNLNSQKSLELAKTPNAALCIHWKSIHRQVRARGGVQAISHAEADAYFKTRPRDSQIGAWASKQSQLLEEWPQLTQRVAEVNSRFANRPVERPEFWSGFLLVPTELEFWRAQTSRLHHRTLFRKVSGSWHQQLLYP
jgi:pyridoxamine 5'-phosphate oxidase